MGRTAEVDASQAAAGTDEADVYNGRAVGPREQISLSQYSKEQLQDNSDADAETGLDGSHALNMSGQ